MLPWEHLPLQRTHYKSGCFYLYGPVVAADEAWFSVIWGTDLTGTDRLTNCLGPAAVLRTSDRQFDGPKSWDGRVGFFLANVTTARRRTGSRVCCACEGY
jgi:hypothetical protein